jgi:type IV pilus assembly protein PilX
MKTIAPTLWPKRRRPSDQRGVALIVSVLLMLLISLLGLTAMRSNNLDERMAFNQRDRQVAFQAAEAALRDGEQYVATNKNSLFAPLMEANFSATCETGVCRSAVASPKWAQLSEAEWTSTAAAVVGSTASRTLVYGAASGAAAIAGVSAPPRFFVEYQGTNEPIDVGMPCVANFLISARGNGNNAATLVTLQSVFRLRVGVCYAAI